MQSPHETDLIDFDSPPTPSTQNTPKAKQAATDWEACLAESKDTARYPRVRVIDGPFQGYDDMLYEKENGNYNIANPFQRPTGPTHKHITHLQNQHAQGRSIDDIAAWLVVTYPDLMKGWKNGTEFDRRVQIHGLVNIWVSRWAPRFGEDGRVVAGEGGFRGGSGEGRGGMGLGMGGQGERYGGGKGRKSAVQAWLREQNSG